MRRIGILIAIATLALLVAPPVAAIDGDPFEAALQGGSFPDFDPAHVAAECPAGYQWILHTYGEGQLTYGGRTEQLAYNGKHCSRWVTPPTDTTSWFRGRVAAGTIVLDTARGSLVLEYLGLFLFKGDATIPDFEARVWLVSSVDGAASTGDFAGSTGFVRFRGYDDTGSQIVWLSGLIAG